MARVKGGPRAHAKHKKVLKLAKGYQERRSKTFRRAHEAVLRAGEHAFAGRKEKKRQFRRLWIARLNGALFDRGIKYSRFIAALKKEKVELDRKVLSQLANLDPKAFDAVVEKVRKSL